MRSTIELMYDLFKPVQRLIQVETKGYEHYDHTLLEANNLHYDAYFSHEGVNAVARYEDSDNIPADVKNDHEYYVENLEIKGLFCHDETTDKYVQVSIIGVDDMAVLMTALENYIIENS